MRSPTRCFICYYYETAALVLRQSVDVGLESWMLGADGWTNIQMQLEDDLSLLISRLLRRLLHEGGSEVTDAFVASFEAKYGTPRPLFNALGYDAAKIMLTAIENAGTTEAEAVIAQLKATDIEGGHRAYHLQRSQRPIKSAFIKGFENGVPHGDHPH